MTGRKGSAPAQGNYSLVLFTFLQILRLTVPISQRADKAKNVSPMPKNGEPLSGHQNKNVYH
jgi:hypothetical protein